MALITRPSRRTAGASRLIVDWTRCDGHGLCAELLPEVVTLDDWGFPVVGSAVPPHLEELALRARAACPVLALRLERE